jgi:hypothetical protein
VDAAAWGVVAEIGSSKQMAGVSAVSGKFAEILRLLWLQGEARSGGQGCPRCGGVGICSGGCGFEASPALPNRLEKFDLIRGFATHCTQSTSKGTRTKFWFCERGGGDAA